MKISCENNCTRHYPRMIFFMIVMFFMGVVIVFQHAKLGEQEEHRIAAYKGLYRQTQDKIDEMQEVLNECIRKTR